MPDGTTRLPQQSRRIHGWNALAQEAQVLIETCSRPERIFLRAAFGPVGAGRRESEKVVLLSIHPDLVFHHEVHELVAVDQRDRLPVFDLCGLLGSRAEFSCSDDQTEIVKAEAASYLIDHRAANVALPTLHLCCDLDRNRAASKQRASYIHSAITALRRHRHALGAHCVEQLTYQVLEFHGISPPQKIQEGVTNPSILGVNRPPHSFRLGVCQTDQAMA